MSGLEELLANATPGPWELLGPAPNVGYSIQAATQEVCSFRKSPYPAEGLLIALAPDLARLALDMGEALRLLEGAMRFDEDGEMWDEIAKPLLARLSALDGDT